MLTLNPEERERIEIMRAKIAEIGKLMYERKLTDAAGGNISVRIGNYLLITPRMAGSHYRWQLSPQQVLSTDLQGNNLQGDGEPSRESRVHIKLLNTYYPQGQAVVHGHALNALVFCAAGKPLPSLLYSTDKFGEIKIVRSIPVHSAELAEEICEALRGQEDRVEKYAAVILAQRHGVFVLAKDLNAGYDALERVEGNAYCALMSKLLTA